MFAVDSLISQQKERIEKLRDLQKNFTALRLSQEEIRQKYGGVYIGESIVRISIPVAENGVPLCWVKFNLSIETNYSGDVVMRVDWMVWQSHQFCTTPDMSYFEHMIEVRKNHYKKYIQTPTERK